MTTQNLLVELLVEELPPKALKKLGEAFAAALTDSLKAQGLATAHSATTPFATPRRLAAHISAVRGYADDKAVSQKLMPVSVGFDLSGFKTPALIKRLQALGVEPTVQDRMVLALSNTSLQQIRTALEATPQQVLRRAMDGKAEALYFDSTVKGATLQEGLQKALTHALSSLPIPKLMQYQLADGWTSVHFVRPAHGLVALHGAEVVNVQALGLTAGRETQGHRFEAAMSPVMLQHADHYAQQMEEQGAVVASFAARHGDIVRQLNAAAAKQGLSVIDDAALLDEVTALVERPNVLLCRFEPEYLAVPQECLILTMKANQKYFPLLDAAGTLTNQFLIVSNIRPDDPRRVVEGNERVVRPRLADAKFFFDQDRKKTLASRVAGLDKVVYHGKLGTLSDRTDRVRAIARMIGKQLGRGVLETRADKAAELSKADLFTDMVGEFPELQGTMGRYYAQHDGLSDEVAFAIEDHYKPRFSGDDLPRNMTGLVVALADKLETLVGMFGVGQMPTGDKDPFALRRHAVGVIRLLTEGNLSLQLDELFNATFGSFHIVADDLPLDWELANTSFSPFERKVPVRRAMLFNFMFERFAGLLREQGYSGPDVEAVLELRPQCLAEVPNFLVAVRAFAALPESAPLAAANKRVSNILKKAEVSPNSIVLAALLREPAEIALSEALAEVRPQADAAFTRGDYTASLCALAALKGPVDAFFESVMVNAEDPALRNNRLALLASLHAAMNRVADLSKLAS